MIFVANVKSAIASAQIPDFYYYYTEKVYLNLSTEMITISFEETVTKEQRQAFITGDPILKDMFDEKLPSGLALIATKQRLNKEGIAQTLERLNKLPEIKYSAPVFQFRNLKLILMDEFIVRFNPDIKEQDIQRLNEENEVEVVRGSPYRHNRYVLRVMNPKDKSALEMANIYNQKPQIEYATPNFLVIGGYCSTYPDDTYFQEQWALNNTRQTGGTPDADIDAPEAWDIATDSDIVVAVIDSGVDYNHPDLAVNMWINPGEDHPPLGIVGPEDFDGVDDDGNGYVDDIYGWDFACKLCINCYNVIIR